MEYLIYNLDHLQKWTSITDSQTEQKKKEEKSSNIRSYALVTPIWKGNRLTVLYTIQIYWWRNMAVLSFSKIGADLIQSGQYDRHFSNCENMEF